MLKRLKIVAEQQTGDDAFDSQVYIRSDHTALGTLLAESDDARTAVSLLFGSGARGVRCDGEYLWIELPHGVSPRDEQLRAMEVLYGFLESARKSAKESHEPVGRIALAEALIWGVATYAITGVVELIGVGQSIGDKPHFALLTFVSAVVLAGILGPALVLLLRRSSWATGVIFEGGVALAICLPLTAGVAVIDFNRYWDRATPQRDFYRVIERHFAIYERRGGRASVEVTNEYAVRLSHPDPSRPQLRRFVQVTKEVYQANSQEVAVTWRPGALGIPWVEEIEQGRLYAGPSLFDPRYRRGGMIAGGFLLLILVLATAFAIGSRSM